MCVRGREGRGHEAEEGAFGGDQDRFDAEERERAMRTAGAACGGGRRGADGAERWGGEYIIHRLAEARFKDVGLLLRWRGLVGLSSLL